MQVQVGSDGSAAPAWLPRWVPAHLGSYSLCGERGPGTAPKEGQTDSLGQNGEALATPHVPPSLSFSVYKVGCHLVNEVWGGQVAGEHTPAVVEE